MPSRHSRLHLPLTVGADSNVVNVESYIPPDPGPYPEDVKNQNMVRFTPTQVEAVKSGVREGLTLIVGPPGDWEN